MMMLRNSTRPAARAVMLCIAALLTLSLTACGGGEPADSGDTPVDPTQPQRGGSLTIAIQADAKSLDPHRVSDAGSYRIIENLYSTLLRQTDEYGVFEPDLAESIEISDDKLTYTITLKPGLRFHSGNAVTSEDVAFSLRRIKDVSVRASQFEAVESIETPDERTVVLKLSRPSSPLRTHLGHPMNAIVEKAVVEANDGKLDRVDAGGGPFALVEWQKNQKAVMQRFPGYHVEGLPYLDELTYRPMPQEMNRLNAIRTGDVDIVLDISARSQPVLEREASVEIGTVPGTFWEYIGLNCEREPFDDVRVRQAVAWTVDRATVNKLAKFGAAQVRRGGHLPPNHWAVLDEVIYPEPDIEKARQLLADAGYPDGFETTIKVGADFDYQVNAATVIKQQLQAIGISASVESMPSTSFFDALGSHDFDMTVVGWVGLVDPDEWTWNIFHTDGRSNQQQYSNAELDALLVKGRETFGHDERAPIYQQAQRIIATEAPVVSLYVNDQTSAWRERVHGFVVHPTASTLSLRETWVVGE